MKWGITRDERRGGEGGIPSRGGLKKCVEIKFDAFGKHFCCTCFVEKTVLIKTNK